CRLLPAGRFAWHDRSRRLCPARRSRILKTAHVLGSIDGNRYAAAANLPMRTPLALLVVVAVAIASIWWWLGAPIAMPPSPLGAGEKLSCVSYAPFRGQQSPLDPTIRVDAAQIDDDLTRLSRVTDCVRTYSTRNGIDQVPEIAARHGMKVIQGIWLGG